MGLRAQLLELPARLFADMDQELKPQILQQAPVTFLDKSWYELHLLFAEMERPLSEIISGEREYPDGSPSLDDFIADKGHDYYIALTAPLIVQKIAAALAALSDPELIGIANRKGIELDTYTQKHLDDLKAAYSHAAANGNGTCIVIA